MKSIDYTALLLLLLLSSIAIINPAAAAWTPPTDTAIYGVEWNASDPSPVLKWIDADGNPISAPNFSSHVIWGNIKRVLLDDSNVVTRVTNPRGDGLDLSGASGKVMTEIPKFYVKSENASTDTFRYYRWWISPEPADGFTLHPAFVQRGGTERDYIYIGSYEATLRVLDNGTLALDSRSGEQPWTGYYTNPRDGMFKLGFDAGTAAISTGDTVTGNTSGTSGTVVDLYVSSGSWATNDATGILYLKQTSGTFTSGEPLKVGGTTVAAANTTAGNACLPFTINDAEGYGETLGPGYGAMNVWSLSAIKMLYLVEHATWASQETTGLGIVNKASGTGFNGEVTGYGSVDTNVNEYGTGTGTGTAGYTPASYRTMTDLWGNSWEWVTGYTSTNTQYQITKRDGTGSLSTHPLAAGSYETSSVAPLGASGYTYGYWTSLEYEDLLQYQFIPNSVTGGSSTTYGTDYFYSHNPGTRVLRAGGVWSNGRDAGLGSLTSDSAASDSYRNRGARLEFVGPSTLAGDAPGANYTQNVTVGNAPLVVAFNDTSTGSPGWWLWDFGDGNSSTEQHPVYTYVSPGNYTVTMTAYTLYGSSTTNKTSIEVFEAPVANFTTNTTEGNAPLTVQFTDTSTGTITAWDWAFGDGNSSTEQHPVYTYVSPGTYQATLNVSNAYGYSHSNKTIEVLEPPTANFTANTTEGNAPLTVQFNDTSTGDITAWNWSFGDGNSSTDQHPIYTYVSPGIYQVTLNVSNAYSSSISPETTITVLSPPAASFTANTTEGNAPLTVQFTDTSTGDITVWNWTFGDGNSSTDHNPVYTYVSPGTYQVTLNVSNAYGYSHSNKTIEVFEPPIASFTTNTTGGNAPLTVQFNDTSTGDITAWNWSFGDGNSSTDQHPIHTYVSPGTYQVTLNVSNAYSSSISPETTVTVLSPPAASFTANTTEGNAPLTVQFTDTSTGDITVWNWTFGDGNSSTDQHPVYTYVSPGTYLATLNVSNAHGYSLSNKTIEVLEPPTANFTANITQGLIPLTVQFTDTSTGNVTAWNWTFGDGNSSTDRNPTHTYVAAGIYTVSLTASNAYSNDTLTRTDLIAAYSPLVANFTTNITQGLIPLTVQFNDTSTGSPTSWFWTFGDGNSSTDQNPVHTYTEVGYYTVSLTVSHPADEKNITRTNAILADYEFTASFTQNTTYGMVPLPVQFTDTTDTSVCTPSGYYWTFGDGNSSTDQNPVHTYTQPGYYNVSLTVYGILSQNTKTKVSAVHVGILPTAAFTADPTSGHIPLTVQFVSSCQNTNSYYWAFGDGATSTQQNPSHTYVTAGTYTVTLTATNVYGSATANRTITVTEVPPIAGFTASPLTGEAPTLIKFTDTSTNSPTSWFWDFGDGNISTARHPTHLYYNPGTYTVTLTVSNTGGSNTLTKPNYITLTAPEPSTATPRFPETDRVKTLEATDLGTSSVTLHGSLDADTAREVWFEYGTKSNSYGFTVARQQAEPGEVFSATVSSFPLVAGQTYYYRAACADGYGRERSFTLPVIPPGPLPTYGAAASQFIDSYKNESTMIEDIATATWSPYTDILGSLFFAMIIGAVFLNLAMKGRSLALPAMLVLVIGLSLWTLLPPEAAMIAQAFIILAIGGIIYWISTKRKI